MWWKLFKTRKYHIYSKNVVYIHIVYETYLCPFTVGKDLTLGIALFGAIKLIKNADFDKYKYSDCGIGFDARGGFSLYDGTWFGKNVIIFDVNIWC